METLKIDEKMNTSKFTCNNIVWKNVITDFKIHGKINSAMGFNRLPVNIETNNNILYLSKHPSGLYIDFVTDSTSINLHVKTSSTAYMPHMSATGQIGLDLYYEDMGKYKFLATTKINEKEYLLTLIKDLPKKPRSFRLYLPLYVVLDKLNIGIDSTSVIKDGKNPPKNKIITYGTSITQGGCATRPGMSYPSILGRIVNYEIINLGFSGSCHLELEIAELIGSVDNLNYLIIEAQANISSNVFLKEQLPQFINKVKTLNKELEIILISHFPYANTLVNVNLDKEMRQALIIQKEIAEKFKIIFISGLDILEEFSFDESVDGIHLTDLGFYKIANYLKPYIKDKLYE